MSSTTMSWLFTEQELMNSPSNCKGITVLQEAAYRRHVILFMRRLALIFKIPKLAETTANVFFHRFFIRESFDQHDMFLVGATCLFLGAKVEDYNIKVTDFAKHFLYHAKALGKERVPSCAMPLEELCTHFLFIESVVLHALAYDLSLSHPYGYINEKVQNIVALCKLDAKEEEELSLKLKKISWTLINDSYQTNFCLRITPEGIAATAVYVAGLFENSVPMTCCTPDGLPWWSTLGVKKHDLDVAGKYLLQMYIISPSKNLPPAMTTLLSQFCSDKAQPCDSFDSETRTDTGDSDTNTDDEHSPELKKSYHVESQSGPDPLNCAYSSADMRQSTRPSPNFRKRAFPESDQLSPRKRSH